MQAPLEPVQRAFDRLKLAANTSPFPTAEVREDRLDRLDKLVVQYRDAFVVAISADFGTRSRAETLSADVLLTIQAIRDARRNVRSWMRKQPVLPNPFFLPSSAFIEFLPRGVIGVIAPWNYPVNLALGPLAGVLAAGNRALVKPSELTPKTSALIAKAVAEFFSAEEIAVVTGGPEVARAVTALPLDGLVFTGSTPVGKLVAAAAAQHLTPVTLELGGKSPALIHPSYDLARAAERVVVGKLFNGGQTCIAPDYVLVPKGSEGRFLAEASKAVARCYPRLEGFTSIINDRAKARLEGLVDDARSKGARVELLAAPVGGRVMAPVALLGVTAEMRVSHEEIFGPVLPIELYDTLDEAIDRINARPRPLAFYYFDEDLGRADGVLSRVVSGGASLNDTLVHFAQEHLPFGGVGASGVGAYHGFKGFETFSHARSVLVASSLSPARKVMTPPIGAFVERALDLMIRGLTQLRG